MSEQGNKSDAIIKEGDVNESSINTINKGDSGNNGTAKFVLQDGIEAVYGNSTPLHLASEGSEVNLELKCLSLEKNMAVDARNKQNETPLHIAVKHGYADKVQILLNNNASVVAQTDEGCTPLLLALEGRHEEIVGMILKHVCENSKNVNDEESVCSVEKRSCNQLNQILLGDPVVREKINKLLVRIITEEYDHSKSVDYLTDYGFTFDCAYIDESLLLSATRRSYVKLLKNILINFVGLEVPRKYPLLLHTAVKYRQRETIDLFLKSGFDANAEDEQGKTPICYSLKSYGEDDCVEILQLLLDGGADAKKAPELLHQAITQAYFKFCKILIENRADVNALNSDGNTPLHLTIPKEVSWYYRSLENQIKNRDEDKRFEIAELLLTNCADVNIKARDGFTAFHHAVSSKNEKFVCMFLKFGAYVDVRAEDGSTALHVAADKGHANIVDILCRNHADVNARRKDGSTPLHSASRIDECRSTYECIQTLLNNGSDINAENDAGKTALDIAISSNTMRWTNHDTTLTLAEHLIKLRAAALYVSEKNLRMINFKHCYPRYKKKCETQVKQMRNMELLPRFTVLNILTDNRMPSYSKNKLLMEKLKTFSFEQLPCYASLLRTNFRNCKARLELLESGQNSLGALIKTSMKLNENKYLALPSELLEQIILYLSNSEITSLIYCQEALKRQVSQ